MGDYRVQVKHGVRPPDVAEISDLLVATTAADGHPPLDDQRQLDLQRGGREGFTAVLAHEVDDAELVGYAQLAPERASWGLEIVVHPDHRGGLEHLGITLLGAAVEEVHRQGGGRLRYWAPQPTPQQDANAAALGFINDRDLLQLRVELPLAPGTRRDAPPLDVRPFRPGADEAVWLEVNNRAFVDHPEQGGWDLEALQAREDEPWFDPAGFLLHEEDGRLAGSCWTKVHRDVDPALGEIYVISVDPDFHHRGLGRALTVAGLDWLAAAGLAVGMLYVDNTNTAAVALYRSLGFSLDHMDRAYILDVPGP
jgi:mycothiol synthase